VTIPAAWLDELRSRTTLSSMIQRSTPLKKAGREWKACCPFHNEKSPSFTVNDEKGFYHCFGCGAHGDVIRWMTDQMGASFLDAIRELAQAAGMEVPAPDPRQQQRQDERERLVGIMDQAQRFFARQLASEQGADARRYLSDRGVGSDMIERFGIGFAPSSKMGEVPRVAAIGASPADLATLGLVKSNEETGTTYDFFRRRIMIPIHDARGRPIAFTARILGAGEPKYLNSPDTPVFDKGKVLFNLHRAAPQARATKRLLIVEGQMDVIATHSVGFSEVVAPSGTAITEAQLALAWKLVDQPTICFDGDRPGRAAALRAALRALPMLEPGKGLNFVFPPDGQDPDDVARAGGAQAIANMVADAFSLAEIVWRASLDRLKEGGTAEMSRIRADLRSLVASIRDPDVKAAYSDDFAARLASLRQRAPQARENRAPARLAVSEAVQEAILQGVARQPDAMWAVAEDMLAIRWATPELERLFEGLMTILESQESMTLEALPEQAERAGIGEQLLNLQARQVLRFPFLTEADQAKARHLLHEAIVAEGQSSRRTRR
jgi:DNA primase